MNWPKKTVTIHMPPNEADRWTKAHAEMIREHVDAEILKVMESEIVSRSSKTEHKLTDKDLDEMFL